MTHKNDMTTWDEIACQRDHEHVARLVTVNLGAEHGYDDRPQIPSRYAFGFQMFVWDSDAHPVDDGPYCPAHDAVSATIVSHGIWEPAETIMLLHVLHGQEQTPIFVDLGAQVGWFSIIAASCGAEVWSIDADQDNLDLLEASMKRQVDPRTRVVPAWWGLRARIGHEQVFDEAMAAVPIRLVKIDVEGAEPEAVDMLWPSIQRGLIDHLLIEVSPVFHDRYPDMVVNLIGAGYDAFVMPPRMVPPVRLDTPDALEHGRLDGDYVEQIVAGWHQENVWFKRRGVSW